MKEESKTPITEELVERFRQCKTPPEFIAVAQDALAIIAACELQGVVITMNNDHSRN